MIAERCSGFFFLGWGGDFKLIAFYFISSFFLLKFISFSLTWRAAREVSFSELYFA